MSIKPNMGNLNNELTTTETFNILAMTKFAGKKTRFEVDGRWSLTHDGWAIVGDVPARKLLS